MQKYVYGALIVVLLASSAHAFDPMEGAGYVPQGRYARGPSIVPPMIHRMETSIVPLQGSSYHDPAAHMSVPAPALQAPAPAPIAVAPAPAPAPVAQRQAPIENPMSVSDAAPVMAPAQVQVAAAPVAAPIDYAAIAPAAGQPAYTYDGGVDVPPMRREAPKVDPNQGKIRSSIGIEYFTDNYQEESLGLDSDAWYVAGTGRIAYHSHDMYTALDLRVSYGEEDYYSTSSGSASGIPQWEFDNRILFGFDSAESAFSPYIGFGNRYYRDELKGTITSLNDVGYDRRIFQLYIPVGVDYTYMSDGWHFRPNIEFDYMVYGNVSSRLRGTGLANTENVENRQKDGWGLRSEFMIGRAGNSGTGFEFGPFVRYWSVDDSEVEVDSFGGTWIEPENTRLQIGATARVLF